MLFKNEFERVRDKLMETITKLSKGKAFNDVFLPFLIHKSEAYLKKDKVSSDQLTLDFGNYVNQVHFGTLTQLGSEVKVK